MKNSKSLQNSIIFTFFSVGILWCIKSYELMFHVDMSMFGVRPLELTGLLGILTAPLVHGSLEHIFNNTLPLLILGSVLIYGYPKSRWRVIGLVWLISGLGVWFFARPATHIGASGLTHGVFFFLFLVSILRRDKSSIAIMMIAFFMYGGIAMTIFPREEGISYEYHFFGALGGVVSALLWHKEDPKPIEKRYAWQDAPDEDDPVIGSDWQTEEQSDETVVSNTADEFDRANNN
jgi:membrane associated rhomboid family serine protease